MDAQRLNDDDDADLGALQAAVTEFVSQLQVEGPRADETPVFQAPVDPTLGPALQLEPVRLLVPGPLEAPTIAAPSAPPPRVRRWPLLLTKWRPGRLLLPSWRPGWLLLPRWRPGRLLLPRWRPGQLLLPRWRPGRPLLPKWRPGRPLLWGLPAVAIAACVATGVWWLADRTIAPVAAPPTPVVQAPQPRTPRLQTAQSPRRAVRIPARQKAVTRAPKRTPIVVVPPVRRADRLPLPAPAVPPFSPVPLATPAPPSDLAAVSELEPPPAAITPPARAVPPFSPVPLATLAPPSDVAAVSELGPPPSAITPPGIVYQGLPRPQVTVDQTVSVLLVILINQRGAVDRAFIGSTPVIPRYEQQLLEAAKTWRYTPALLNGRPIPYRKTLRVTVPASRTRG